MSVQEENFEKLLQIVPNLKDLRAQVTLTAPGFMDLGVSPLDQKDDSRRIALIHYRRHQSGSLSPDPEMEVEVDFDGRSARALTFKDSIIYQETEGIPELQGELNRFLELWLSNLIAQGHKPPAPATPKP